MRHDREGDSLWVPSAPFRGDIPHPGGSREKTSTGKITSQGPIDSQLACHGGRSPLPCPVPLRSPFAPPLGFIRRRVRSSWGHWRAAVPWPVDAPIEDGDAERLPFRPCSRRAWTPCSLLQQEVTRERPD